MGRVCSGHLVRGLAFLKGFSDFNVKDVFSYSFSEAGKDRVVVQTVASLFFVRLRGIVKGMAQKWIVLCLTILNLDLFDNTFTTTTTSA